jgi:DNA primase
MDIDTEELKAHAPLIPYVKNFYKDKIHIVRETKNVAFAPCIFHAEKTASLALFANGTYKCFGGGCGASGDVIKLVMEIENLPFLEACKMIGDNIGYDIILEEPNPIFENYKDNLDNHTRRYWANLQNNGDALRYLVCERGISKEMIDKFRLGFTDKEEFKFRTDIGNISNRIVFPILEHKRRNPKCVGMAYRGLSDEKPKYINDLNQDGREGQNPQLAGVFIKGDLLYGLPMAYESIAKNNHVILVEGYLDVISMHQAGITNTVASMGTAITENQIKAIRGITENVLLFMDGDNAGECAMLKSIGDLYAAGLNVAVCLLNNNMDPADLCKSLDFNNMAIRMEIKNHTRQGIELVINNAVEKYENIATTERTKALRIAMPIIESVQDPAIKELYKSKLFNRLDIK